MPPPQPPPTLRSQVTWGMDMRAAALVMFGLVFMASTVKAQDHRPARLVDTRAVPANLAALAANPKRFAGKRVLVRGKIDQCSARSCNICTGGWDTPETQRRCVGVIFALPWARADQADRARERGQDQLYRFSDVTLSAWISPEPLARMRPGRADPRTGVKTQDVILRSCDWRCGPLIDAQVLRVHERRAATEGFVTTGYAPYDAHLTALPAADDAAVRSALAEAGVDWPNPAAVRTYGGPHPNEDAPPEAWACVSLDGSDRWPTRFGDLQETSLNPYRCWYAEKLKAGWRLPAED